MARVLVIEDNPASLDLMGYLLKAFNHTPLTARDGLEGIAVAERESPDLILCDIQLPGVSGIEVCRRLKLNPALKKVPLVAVTAYAMVGDREKLLSAGFNGYISKPINPQTFMDQIAPYLRSSQSAVMKKFMEYKVNPVELTAGTILVVDNSPVNIKLAHSMLEPFGYQVLDASFVAEAMSLLSQAKPDAILSDVHMPHENGFDFLRMIKSNASLSSIPFIFMSATVWGASEQVRGLSLGADRFIIRPVEPQFLVDEIETCRKEWAKRSLPITS